MMADGRYRILRVVDAVGGMIVAACALGFVWTALLEKNPVRTEIAQLRQALSRARDEHHEWQAELERQEARLVDYRTQRARVGRLPAEVPIEAYFQQLSQLATRHNLHVLRQQPLASRTYPGLLEERYAYEVTGSLVDLVAFFESIEQAEFWADMSYLRLEQGAAGSSADSSDRIATLTLSLFAAPAREGRPEGEGT